LICVVAISFDAHSLLCVSRRRVCK